MADDDDEALLSALTTEHFVLQSARSTISSEAAARSTLYVGAVSSGLVALGFASELIGDSFGVFVAAVIPALIALGEVTFVRLVEISVEDLRYLRQIQAIRRYYGTLHSQAHRFFPVGEDDEGYVGLFRVMGIAERSRMQALFTAATAVAAINGVIAGVGVGVLVGWAGAPVAVAAISGVVFAVAFVVLHVSWERRRYGARLATD